MSKPIYDVAYFIAKFEAIPDDRWTKGVFLNVETGQRCAAGHCMEINSDGTLRVGSPESLALLRLTEDFLGLPVTNINDYQIGPYTQSTPKARILAALQDIKKQQQREPKI